MRNLLLILFTIGVFSSCKECLTCPENYVIKNDICHCESGFIRNNKCGQKAHLRENSIFIQEDGALCPGFEEISLLKYVQHDFRGVGVVRENIYLYNATLPAARYRLLQFSSDSFYAPSWHITGDLGVISNLTLEPFKREIDGKTCYLRFNSKVVSPNHLRWYFFWMTKNDELKSDYCIRNFYQPL